MSDDKPTPLTARTFQIVSFVTLTDRCECGAEISTTDPNCAQAIESGRTVMMACPQCGQPHSVTKSLVIHG